jgi:hypothetical protein
VLIHCLAGAHRAGTTGVAVLMHFANMDVSTATFAAKVHSSTSPPSFLPPSNPIFQRTAYDDHHHHPPPPYPLRRVDLSSTQPLDRSLVCCSGTRWPGCGRLTHALYSACPDRQPPAAAGSADPHLVAAAAAAAAAAPPLSHPPVRVPGKLGAALGRGCMPSLDRVRW